MNLEGRFHQEMLRIYEEAKGFGYYPNYFLGMMTERGGLLAAKSLLAGNRLSDGFVRLWEEGRLDLQSKDSRYGTRGAPCSPTRSWLKQDGVSMERAISL